MKRFHGEKGKNGEPDYAAPPACGLRSPTVADSEGGADLQATVTAAQAPP